MAILLIILTLLYANLNSIFYSNFTVIGNQQGHFVYFFIYTFLLGTYFFSQSSKVFKKFNFTFPYQKTIAIFIYLSCIITPLIPYTETNQILDDFHVFLIMSSVFLFLTIWFFFLIHIKTINKELISKIELPFILFIHLLGLIFLSFDMINSLIEVLIILFMIALIEFLKKK